MEMLTLTSYIPILLPFCRRIYSTKQLAWKLLSPFIEHEVVISVSWTIKYFWIAAYWLYLNVLFFVMFKAVYLSRKDSGKIRKQI